MVSYISSQLSAAELPGEAAAQMLDVDAQARLQEVPLNLSASKGSHGRLTDGDSRPGDTGKPAYRELRAFHALDHRTKAEASPRITK